MWRVLNAVRGLCFIIGWFIISLAPLSDRLTNNLVSADENILDPNAAVHQPTVVNGHPQGYVNEAYINNSNEPQYYTDGTISRQSMV